MTQKTVFISLVILLTSLHFSVIGQVCDGNFGEDIFDDGDFGSGSAQVLADDPGIAPGYQYTTELPPNDGFYTIVNSLERSQIFDSWLPI